MLILDSDGRERVRLEGYLPNADFVAWLRCGLGRLAFLKKRHADAERWYDDVMTHFGSTHFGAEAMYWRAVARYSASHDHTVLGQVAQELPRRYPTSVWTVKSDPWRAS